MESDSDADFEGREDATAKREFDKMEKHLLSSGYREGATTGKEASFQSGFDTGYAEGFRTAFSLGKFNGVLEALRRNAQKLSLDVQDLESCSFENTRHGLCPICKESSKKASCKDNSGQSECSCKSAKDIPQVTASQRELAKTVLEEQISKCSTVLGKARVLNLVLGEQE